MNNLVSFFQQPVVGFLLKLLAGIATAIFGIIGLGRDVRTKAGSLTPKGRIALIGIIVAGVLAAGSGVYDYSSAQKTARDEQLKSKRLLASVQRGIYPFKGMTASFTLYFLKDFRGLPQYKQVLRSAISKDKSCIHTKAFQCYGFDAGRPYLYRIPPTSALFPSNQSPVRIVFENVGLVISVLKKVPDQKNSKNANRYSQLGSFGIFLYDHTPEEWYAEYDWDHDKLALDVESMEVPDSSLLHSKIFSLTDIVPGAMAAQPDNSDDRLCGLLASRHISDCANGIIDPLSDGLAIESVDLHFKYPKGLGFGLDGKLPCKLRPSPQLLGSFFLSDIDASSSLNEGSTTVSSNEKQLLCEGLERAWRGEN